MSRYVSPLRYPGGKAKMSPWLTNLFDDHIGPMDVEVWIEPFAGGAGAGLTALSNHGIPELWLYEAHPGLNAFWSVIADGQADQLAGRVRQASPTVSAFMGHREIVAGAMGGEVVDQMELALSTFMVNRLSRSGMVNGSAGPIGGWKQSGRWRIDSRFGAEALAGRIEVLGRINDRIKVLGTDGVAGIEDLAGSGVEDEVFCFVDPPYVVDGGRLYSKSFDQEDHARLAGALYDCRSPWVLTYDAHPVVRELYQDFRILGFEIPHTANRRAMDIEYLVLSNNVTPPEGHPLNRGQMHWVQEAQMEDAA